MNESVGSRTKIGDSGPEDRRRRWRVSDRRYWLLIAVGFCIGWSVVAAPVTARADVDVGDEPEFELGGLDGEQVSLSDYRGEVVLVDFWATWCEPCRQSMPFYQKLYRNYDSDQFEVLAISVDERRSSVAEFRQRHDLSFSVLLDGEHRVAKEFEPPTMPTCYLVDDEGIVQYRHVGFADGDRRVVKERIETLLEESADDEEVDE